MWCIQNQLGLFMWWSLHIIRGLDVEKHKDELLELGYEPNDIGVHSIRKGAGTYASSGTTAAPSSVSVNNRGGCTLGGVRDVYMLYERAGDQYVGRILSGMNVLSAKFGASAPDFFYQLLMHLYQLSLYRAR